MNGSVTPEHPVASCCAKHWAMTTWFIVQMVQTKAIAWPLKTGPFEIWSSNAGCQIFPDFKWWYFRSPLSFSLRSFHFTIKLPCHCIQISILFYFRRLIVSWPRTWNAWRTCWAGAGRTTSRAKSWRPTGTASGPSLTPKRSSTTGQERFNRET